MHILILDSKKVNEEDRIFVNVMLNRDTSHYDFDQFV